MRAMTYRGLYELRVEEKDRPRIEHPDDAIVTVQLAAICGSDRRHQLRDPVVVGGPWMAGAGAAVLGARRVVRTLRS
jgi:threonine dehydrogenase-like Zn-dependent dehydrogenase